MPNICWRKESRQCTHIPAFLAARTPEGASSKTRIFFGSTGSPYSHRNS